MKAVISKLQLLLWILVTFSQPLFADVSISGQVEVEFIHTNSGVEYSLHHGWNLIGISKDLGSDSINSFISHVEDSGDATVDSIWHYTSTGWKHYISEDVVAGTNTLESVGPGAGYWVKLSGSGAEFTIESDVIAYTITDELSVDYGGATPIAIETVQPGGVTYQIVTQPAYGTIDESAIASGEVVYTPDIGASTTDTFSYRITDANGLSVVKMVTIEIPEADQSAPAVSLSADPGTVTIAGKLVLAASAEDGEGQIAKVEFIENGDVLYTDIAPPYRHYVHLNAMDYGSHTYQAKAYDLAGNSATSEQLVGVEIGAPPGSGFSSVDSAIEGAKELTTELRNWTTSIENEGLSDPAQLFIDEVDLADRASSASIEDVGEAMSKVSELMVVAWESGADGVELFDIGTVDSYIFTLQDGGNGTVAITPSETDPNREVVVATGLVRGSTVNITMEMPQRDSVAIDLITEFSGSVSHDHAILTVDSGRLLAQFSRPVAVDRNQFFDTDWYEGPLLESFDINLTGTLVADASSSNPVTFHGEMDLSGIMRSDEVSPDDFDPVLTQAGLRGRLFDQDDEFTGQLVVHFRNAGTFVEAGVLPVGTVRDDLGVYAISGDGLTLRLDYINGNANSWTINGNTLEGFYYYSSGEVNRWTESSTISSNSILDALTSRDIYIDVENDGTYKYVLDPSSLSPDGGTLSGTLIWSDPNREEDETHYRELDLFVGFAANLDELPEAQVLLDINRTAFREATVSAQIAYDDIAISINADVEEPLESDMNAVGDITIRDQSGTEIQISADSEQTTGEISALVNGVRTTIGEIRDRSSNPSVTYTNGYFEYL